MPLDINATLARFQLDRDAFSRLADERQALVQKFEHFLVQIHTSSNFGRLRQAVTGFLTRQDDEATKYINDRNTEINKHPFISHCNQKFRENSNQIYNFLGPIAPRSLEALVALLNECSLNSRAVDANPPAAQPRWYGVATTSEDIEVGQTSYLLAFWCLLFLVLKAPFSSTKLFNRFFFKANPNVSLSIGINVDIDWRASPHNEFNSIENAVRSSLIFKKPIVGAAEVRLGTLGLRYKDPPDEWHTFFEFINGAYVGNAFFSDEVAVAHELIHLAHYARGHLLPKVSRDQPNTIKQEAEDLTEYSRRIHEHESENRRAKYAAAQAAANRPGGWVAEEYATVVGKEGGLSENLFRKELNYNPRLRYT